MVKPSIEDIRYQFSGVYFVSPDKKIIGHLRDNNPGIDHPGMIGCFGGRVEVGETVIQGALRELKEETNLHVEAEQLISLSQSVEWRDLTKEWVGCHFYYLALNEDQLKNLQIYEGVGWTYINSSADDKIVWREQAKMLQERLNT